LLVNAQTKKIAELEAACVNLRLEKENLTVGYWELSEKHKALVEFVPLFYMHYLFLLRRLKCGAPKLKELGTVAGALLKANNQRATPSVSGRGRGRGSTKFKTGRVLLDAEVGASVELQPLVKQSFKEGHYSASTGMEDSEWQIMMEQFIAMGVVVKNQVINIDSD
jgi:hypothetical protein